MLRRKLLLESTAIGVVENSRHLPAHDVTEMGNEVHGLAAPFQFSGDQFDLMVVAGGGQ